MSARLDVCRYDVDRLAATLALPARELTRALRVEHEAAVPGTGGSRPSGAIGAETPSGGVALCCHDPRWPLREAAEINAAARGWGAPQVLYVAGDPGALEGIATGRAVAIVGARRPTDYGCEVARALAGELACAGLTVVSGVGDAIAAAAHEGVHAAEASSVAVMTGGADICQPASRRAIYTEIVRRGCAIAELPWGERARRWCYAARNRLVAGLAALVVVVEAEDRHGDLALAHFARSLGRTVAAMPGRVTSPASVGTHALIAGGAPLVCTGSDVLDLLLGRPASSSDDRCHPRGAIPASIAAGARHGAKRERAAPRTSAPRTSAPRASAPGAQARQASRRRARLQEVLDQVRAGADSPERLLGAGRDIDEILADLAELELAGAVLRGDGGRYLPRIGGSAGDSGAPRGL